MKHAQNYLQHGKYLVNLKENPPDNLTKWRRQQLDRNFACRTNSPLNQSFFFTRNENSFERAVDEGSTLNYTVGAGLCELIRMSSCTN